MTAQTPPPQYAYGVSLYSAAWPLLPRAIANFQMGLCATWILPDNRAVTFPLVPHGTVARDSMPERGPSFWTVFQTIEGGLGFWASEKYMTPTPKFRMNGSVDGYNHEVSTPGWDFYGNPLPADQMGIAQLSNRILVPPDGLPLAPGTCGQLLGYAWMALPLIPVTAKPVTTGNQTWTLFFNSRNFRGPVAFYLPVAWSRMSLRYPPAVGRGLDARPGIADSGAIEVNTVPQLVSGTVHDATYAKTPPFQFPANDQGQTVLMHKLTIYSKSALWDQVAAWMRGGAIPSGKFNKSGAFTPKLTANPLSFTQGGRDHKLASVAAWVQTANLDPETFGLQWQKSALSPWQPGILKGTFPQYFRRAEGEVTPILASQVPASTSLLDATFPEFKKGGTYGPASAEESAYAKPGPAAGPFTATLSDGSEVTYFWYRFIDQPAMLDAGLSLAERAKLQDLVEKIQRNWTSKKNYLAPPDRGTLASLDAGLIVTPPKGLEIGYVPIVTSQSP